MAAITICNDFGAQENEICHCFLFPPSICHEVKKWKWSRSVVPSSLQPHGLQHVSLPCPSLSPWVCSNSCPLSWWLHLTGHLILCRPLLLLPSIFPSIRVFSNESALCISWPKRWSFNFSISPSSEYSGLISFRNDWFDLLAVQGTLKSLLRHHNLKASVLWHSAFVRRRRHFD